MPLGQKIWLEACESFQGSQKWGSGFELVSAADEPFFREAGDAVAAGFGGHVL